MAGTDHAGMLNRPLTRKKEVSYRQAVFTMTNVGGHTLASMLSTIVGLEGINNGELTRIHGKESELRTLLTNPAIKKDGTLCGILLHWENNAAAPMAQIDETKNGVSLEAIQASGVTLSVDDIEPHFNTIMDEEQTDGTTSIISHKQWILGILYFAIKDNHVAIIQSLGCREFQLGRYLLWLLQEKQRILEAEDDLQLLMLPKPNDLKLSGNVKVTIRGEIRPDDASLSPANLRAKRKRDRNRKNKGNDTKFKWSPRSVAVMVRDAFANTGITNAIDVDSLARSYNINTTVQFTQVVKDGDTEAAILDITSALRGLEHEASWVIETSDGRITYNEIIERKTIDVLFDGRVKLIDTDDAHEQMLKYLIDGVNSGRFYYRPEWPSLHSASEEEE